MSITRLLQAIADPHRRKILELLKDSDLPAGQIAKHFDMTLPSLSHHLKTLKQADLVTAERSGQEIIYSLNLSVFEETMEYLIKLFKN